MNDLLDNFSFYFPLCLSLCSYSSDWISNLIYQEGRARYILYVYLHIYLIHNSLNRELMQLLFYSFSFFLLCQTEWHNCFRIACNLIFLIKIKLHHDIFCKKTVRFSNLRSLVLIDEKFIREVYIRFRASSILQKYACDVCNARETPFFLSL